MTNDSNQQSMEQTNAKALVVMAVVMMAGGALGVVLSILLDNMAFLGVGFACGTAIGLSLNSALRTGESQDDT